MSTFALRFHNLRVEHNYTLDALANTINKKYGTSFTKATFSKWENGRAEPSFSNIPYIASFFNVTVDYMIGLTDDVNHFDPATAMMYPDKENVMLSEEEHSIIQRYNRLDDSGKQIVNHIINLELDRITTIKNQQIRRLAYYGKIAAAGTFIDSFELLMRGTVDVEDNAMSRSADYVIGVSGDSMEPEYYDGDVVLVSKSRYIDYGDIGIFQYNNDVYIKKLSRDCLESLNPNYAPIPNNGDIRCLGKVLGKAELI